ncbi:hypothetical protein SAY87_005111 [Trapa incisa]|uniref:VQ domain-containing protein n=1 Tax=Trapa incisa TaxID=236973 RepID=A0AAN7JQT2_9MYRT|nr:hypothetical protein SAY87_005111 [Trapa incisa]
MENSTTRVHETMRETYQFSPFNSPRGNTNIISTTLHGRAVVAVHSSFSSATVANNGGIALEIPTATAPITPRSMIPRSEPMSPYPTTFVQADTSNFKHVVQMLTGSSETVTKNHPHQQVPPMRPPSKRSQQQHAQFKLYERRNAHNARNLIINTFVSFSGGGLSPKKNKPTEILSPSMLDFPKLALSPVTPLVDPFGNSSGSSSYSLGSSSSEEEKTIAEEGFFFHPSPANTPRGSAEPQLLPLFPMTSTRVSGASS